MLPSTVGGCSPHGSLSPFNIETFRGICAKGGHFFMVSFSDLFTYSLVIIAIITLVNNRKEK